MYTRADLSVEDRLEIFCHFWQQRDDYGAVSSLAREWSISRHFIYDLASRVRGAVDWQLAGRKTVDAAGRRIAQLQERVQELEAERDHLSGQLEVEQRIRAGRRSRLLLELALCPVSEEKISRCLEAAFGAAVSTGWINEQINCAGTAALAIMHRREVREALREAALDEIFSHHKPILMLVEPQTLMAVAPTPADNRQGETWKGVLTRYPNLELAVSDQGSGLLKGVALSAGKIVHQADLFHFKRNLHREVRRLESYCYAALEKVEQARKLTTTQRLLESARVQARVEYRARAEDVDRKLTAFDWLEVIVAYLEEQFLPYDERRRCVRSYSAAQAVVDEVLELLAQITELNLKPVISQIEGIRANLLTYLIVLGKRLDQIEIDWRQIEGSRAAVCEAWARVWYRRARAGESERSQKQYLKALIGLFYWAQRVGNFTAVGEQVCAALDKVVRASSAVECINSIIRPYLSVKKQLSQRYLALVALYWDMRPLKQRGGRTPFEENGVDLRTKDWVELLESEMRKIAAAAQQKI